MLLSAPRQDLIRAATDMLSRREEPRSADDLAMDLRSRGWTVDVGHLTQVLTRADRLFLRVGDSFRALPGAVDPEALREQATVTREQLQVQLAKLLSSPWWRIVTVRAAFPPLPEEPVTQLARRLDADRRGRVFRVAKVHDDRYCRLLAWVDQVTLTRQENLRRWPCWQVDRLAAWRPGRGPLHLRYESLPAEQVALVRAERDAERMAALLLDELAVAGVRPEDVWLEPVPVDGTEVEARQRVLAEARRPAPAPATGSAAPGRHAAAPRCGFCSGPLTGLEDAARRAHGPCWDAAEPAASAVLRFTRAEWVGAMSLEAWAALVAAPPQGGAPGLSRGRVGNAFA
jgi:hypothetical protein